MDTGSNPRQRVTILMTTRERHSLTEAALDSIIQNTSQPYRLVYAGAMTPEWLRKRLDEKAEKHKIEVVYFDEPLWPNEVRRRLAGKIDTDYVVYIDNDVRVAPGWLDKLVQCADETGAGIVGPLYLWGDGKGVPRIHMAGGKLTVVPEGESRVMSEAHHLFNKELAEVSNQLSRRPCDYVEYHCMLIRTDLARDGSLFDDNILCAHEHIDTALTVRQKGYPVYLEPDSRVTYLAFSEFQLADLPLFRTRWAVSAGESSIKAFSEKWNVINDDRSFGSVRGFLRAHMSQIHPIRAGADVFNDQDRIMDRNELAQSRSDLLDQAIKRGYKDSEINLIAEAYQIMHSYMNACYRPCGRPFINHLVGTASVLIRYGFRIYTVLAGMMHTVYTHRPPKLSGPSNTLDLSRLMGGPGQPVEKLVRAYSLRGMGGTQDLTDASLLSVFDAEIVAIAAANEIDMHLSGEYRYTRRGQACLLPQMQMIERVCDLLGVPGLHETLAEASQSLSTVPESLKTITKASYRLDEGVLQNINTELPDPSAFK